MRSRHYALRSTGSTVLNAIIRRSTIRLSLVHKQDETREARADNSASLLPPCEAPRVAGGTKNIIPSVPSVAHRGTTQATVCTVVDFFN